ncbi:phage baseplate protein [Nocardia pseudobrasiliensis]|uniref:phage baseplate protein n=1 Tax=Nocardia pseudobrasiliensis TaxID=45979 RepID=UPI0009EE5C16|nr:hypothetical protein [Nocardia pseudobrasiliensis]
MSVSRRSLFQLGAGLTAAALTTTRPITARAAVPAGRFELTAPSTTLLWRKSLHDETVLQSFAVDNAHGHIYAVQLKNGGGSDAAGDLCLTKLSENGSVLGHMYLMGFGHGVQIGVEPSGSSAFLWTETDAASNGGSARGTRLGRFEFADGRTLTASSPELTKYSPVAGASITTCAIDPSTDRLIMRYSDGNAFRYAVFELATVKAGGTTRLYDIAQPDDLGTFQGYTAYGNYLYLLSGNAYGDDNPPPGNTYITSVDLRTGARVQHELSQAGKSLDYREPEGMAIQIASGAPRLCFGFASGAPKGRQANVFYKYELVDR